VKTDSLGDILWTKTYGDSTEATAVEQTIDGGFVIGCEHTLDAYPYSQGFIMKTDVSGNEVWESSCSESCGDVHQTTDQGYVAVGGCHDSQHFWFPTVSKKDSLGNSSWSHMYVSYYLGWGLSIEQTGDEGYIVLGYTGNQLLLFKIDLHGAILWDNTYSSSARGTFVSLAKNNGYVVTGDIGGSEVDIYIMRTDSLGDTLWTRKYGREGSDGGKSIRCTTDGGYIVVGCTQEDDLWLLKMETDPVGISEQAGDLKLHYNFGATICNERWDLPDGKRCKIYDITGRIVKSTNITQGIYFIEVDGMIAHKVIKVR
jgi:hypothetical protein